MKVQTEPSKREIKMNQERPLYKEAKWENENFNANKYLCQSAF